MESDIADAEHRKRERLLQEPVTEMSDLPMFKRPNATKILSEPSLLAANACRTNGKPGWKVDIDSVKMAREFWLYVIKALAKHRHAWPIVHAAETTSAQSGHS
jgi:hypothetical protein